MQHAGVARSDVRAALRGTRFRGTLTTATQDDVVGPFLPRGASADRGSTLF